VRHRVSQAALRFNWRLAHCRQAFVGCLFLVEILLRQCDTIPLVRRVRPRNRGDLACDLVMFDCLRCRDEGCIENGLVLDFARDLIGYLN
jgi:hypothetical protein